MKRTFITNLPDESGAFLKASRSIAEAGVNITRVSYNKSVDAHMLFIDVSGEEEQLDRVSVELERMGYTQNPYLEASVIFIEFRLKDEPGVVVSILELIHDYEFNIAYISSQENGTEYQYFKMGLFVENPLDVKSFLERAARLCDLKIIEYSHSEKILDNTVFYLGFAQEARQKLGLSHEKTQELIAQANLLMQMLDEKNELPQKTFGYIARFIDFISDHKGESFMPKVSQRKLVSGKMLFIIDPPCGSSTYILQNKDTLLFVDSGFACYQRETMREIKNLFPEFDSMKKALALTHADIDHGGLLDQFDRIYVTHKTKKNFELELAGDANYREQNALHAPYSRISRIVTEYTPPKKEALVLYASEEPKEQTTPLVLLGVLEFGDITLDVYQGNGGHAIGEAVLVDESNKLVFSGDILVNIKGYTVEQRKFNALAPYLMTSVNMNSAAAKEERDFLLKSFSLSEYVYCCGHGPLMGKEIFS